MAFTKTPVSDTYSSHRVQITREINTRAGGLIGKDEDFVNVFMEPVRDKNSIDHRQFVVKRSGCTQVIGGGALSPVRGSFYWEDNKKFYYAVGRDIFVYNVTTASLTGLINVLATSSGEVGFCEYLYDTNQVVVIATDGQNLCRIDNSEVLTVCADPDMPFPHLPFPVFLDGYLFLVKANTADVYNSDLNDPFAWTPGNFLSAEMEADLVIRIAKLNNYLIVFGTESIEYFWDAANVSGSPMQRNDTPIKINTYLGGWAKLGNNIYYIGKDNNSQPDVFMLKDFKIENVGTPSVSRYLNVQQDGYANWRGNLIGFQGHNFYIVTAGNYTYVMDTETKLWTRWQYQGGTSFPIVSSDSVTSSTKYNSYFALAVNDSTIYKFDESLYQDNGTNFPCVIVTEASDFDTLNRKTMKRLSIIGDRPPTNSNILIQWSDDDYQTFNTGLSTNLNQDLPCVYNLGSFRQRCFKLTHQDNTLFRIQELEVDINKGTS